MSELCEYELKVLRVAAGEDVPDMSWGAAMGQALEFLRGRKLVRLEGHRYTATALGVELLAKGDGNG